ncbi:MAG: DegV family EDD domain-containing protein, partial [Calditrichales bacterium]
LERTPEKLKVLAKAGVVDAGGQGFVHLLEGISQFIESGKIEYILDREIDKMEEIKHVKMAEFEITFRFCTEGLVEAEKIDRKNIRDALHGLGDSLIVAGSTRKVRVHIHTNSPDQCFQILEKHGTITRRKVDDMIRQNETDLGRTDRGKIALVVDSTCDIPPEDFSNAPISFVPVWVYFGNTGYVDRVTLTSDQFYQKIQTDKNHPTTSQPSSADFMKVFSDLMPRYERIICLTLSKNHSGTYQAALTAKRILKSDNIEVMESKNTSAGFGLVARQALKNIQENKTFEQVLEGIKISSEKVRTMVYLDTVNFLIRGGRVSKVKGMMANLLHLRPVLDFANGEILTMGKVRNETAGIEAILNELKSILKIFPNVRIAIVHANAPGKAEKVSEEIFKRFNYKAEYIMSATPALGVHVGPGAIGVAVLPS